MSVHLSYMRMGIPPVTQTPCYFLLNTENGMVSICTRVYAYAHELRQRSFRSPDAIARLLSEISVAPCERFVFAISRVTYATITIIHRKAPKDMVQLSILAYVTHSLL